MGRENQRYGEAGARLVAGWSSTHRSYGELALAGCVVGSASAPGVGAAATGPAPLAVRQHALQHPLLRPKPLGPQWTGMAYDRASCPHWVPTGAVDATAVPKTMQGLAHWIHGLHALEDTT